MYGTCIVHHVIFFLNPPPMLAQTMCALSRSCWNNGRRRTRQWPCRWWLAEGSCSTSPFSLRRQGAGMKAHQRSWPRPSSCFFSLLPCCLPKWLPWGRLHSLQGSWALLARYPPTLFRLSFWVLPELLLLQLHLTKPFVLQMPKHDRWAWHQSERCRRSHRSATSPCHSTGCCCLPRLLHHWQLHGVSSHGAFSCSRTSPGHHQGSLHCCSKVLSCSVAPSNSLLSPLHTQSPSPSQILQSIRKSTHWSWHGFSSWSSGICPSSSLHQAKHWTSQSLTWPRRHWDPREMPSGSGWLCRMSHTPACSWYLRRPSRDGKNWTLMGHREGKKAKGRRWKKGRLMINDYCMTESLRK